MTPLQRRLLLPLFALGGWSGLLYEVLWLRLFSSVLGSTTQSMSAVVTAFLLGSGIGGVVFGRRADRNERLMRLYGLLELGTAVAALFAFALFFSAEGLNTALYRALPWSVFRWLLFFIAFVTVALPAVLIGGALPVLARAVLSSGESARSGLGRLYAAHTVGAALGAMTSVQLVAAFGYDDSYAVATATSAGVGCLALVVGRNARSAPKPEPRGALAPPRSALVPAAILLSGFAALGMEVVWFRLMSYVWRGTLVSFALVLFIYLLGLAAGSAFIARRTFTSDLLLARIQVALCVVLPATLLCAALFADAGAERARMAAVWLSLVFGSTFLFGTTLPLAAGLYVKRDTTVGRDVGRVYAANLVGAVSGSFLTGFVLLPSLGTRATSMLLVGFSAGSALLAFLAATSPPRPRRFGAWIAAAAAVGISIGAGPWVQRYIEGMVRSFDSRIVHMRESELQILTVLEQPRGRRELRGGSHVSGSTDPVRRQTQKLQSHLPMLLHPSPQRVLEIGYGVGELLRTILLYDPERVDLVELDPEMVSVANEWFEALNGRASEDRRVTVHTLDGRAFLRMSQQHYDVVMTDSMFLDSEGALRLYTTEHFQATRARLSSGGIALCWLPLNLDDRAARTVLKTFTQVFPETLVWVPLASNQVEAFLVGFEGRAQIDEREFRARYARYAAPDLAFLGWGEPLPALVSFRAAPADIAALVQGVGENRDRKPVLDFMRDDPTYALRDALLENSPTTLQQHLRLSASTWAQVRRTQQAETKASVVLRTLAGVPVEQRREGAAGFYATLESARALAPGHPAIEKALGRLAAERGPTDPASFATALEHDPYNFKANEHFAERALAQGDLARARMHVQRLTLMEPYFTRAAELRGPAP